MAFSICLASFKLAWHLQKNLAKDLRNDTTWGYHIGYINEETEELVIISHFVLLEANCVA